MCDVKDHDPYISEGDYYAAMEAFPLIEQQQQEPACAVVATTAGSCSAISMRCTDFPGNRRTVLPRSAAGPPPNTVLVKTGGNALQAVPRMLMEQQQQQQERWIAVTVPENVSPGSTIYVQYGSPPYNSDALLLQATIPPGALPGHTFFVQVPDALKTDPVVVTATAEAVSGWSSSTSAGTVASSSASAGVVVDGREAAGDLFLQTETKDQVHNV